MSRRDDISSQLLAMCRGLSGMAADVDAANEVAAETAAKIIQREQRRIFQKAGFKRDKKSHAYQNANEGLIKITKEHTGKLLKMKVGFGTATLRKYPELLMIEFGRPGKSPGHTGNKDKRGRKKGKFPEAAVVMPIRVGYQVSKTEAIDKYAEKMFKAVSDAWNNSR